MAEAQVTHGEARNHRTETESGPPDKMVDLTTGEVVYFGPMTATTHTVCERWCSGCNAWIECRGVLGALKFMGEHDPHKGA